MRRVCWTNVQLGRREMSATVRGAIATINIRSMAMNREAKTFDQTGEELLTHEVSDEALESAAFVEKVGAYTLGNCTGLESCPA